MSDDSSNIEMHSEEKIKVGQYTKKKSSMKWVLTVFCLTFSISSVLYIFSSTSLANVNIYIAFLLLLIFILVGIIFDIVGIAVTSAEEKTLNSMAAKKVKGAKQAVKLIKNAEKVSNICNDVIGDISGVISGTSGAIIVAHLVSNSHSKFELVFGTIITALTAAFTVGGKALGKSVAISKSNNIIFFAGRVIALFTTNPFKHKRRK